MPANPKPTAPENLTVATRDTVSAALRRITALSALLGALSERVPETPMDPETVGETADMIAEEARRIRDALT